MDESVYWMFALGPLLFLLVGIPMAYFADKTDAARTPAQGEEGKDDE